MKQDMARKDEELEHEGSRGVHNVIWLKVQWGFPLLQLRNEGIPTSALGVWGGLPLLNLGVGGGGTLLRHSHKCGEGLPNFGWLGRLEALRACKIRVGKQRITFPLPDFIVLSNTHMVAFIQEWYNTHMYLTYCHNWPILTPALFCTDLKEWNLTK